jgi:hypothetical protein
MDMVSLLNKDDMVDLLLNHHNHNAERNKAIQQDEKLAELVELLELVKLVQQIKLYY